MGGSTLPLFNRLFEPFEDALKKTKDVAGRKITFVPWPHYVARAHKEFPEGYSKQIICVKQVDGIAEKKDGTRFDTKTLIVGVRITDHQTGTYQEGLGSADAGKLAWGGAMAEAESQATRRAFANFGLGLEMYLNDPEFDAISSMLDDHQYETDEREGMQQPEPEEAEEEADDSDLPSEPEGENPAATAREMQVVKDLGATLRERAERDLDSELANFLDEQVAKLKTFGLTHRVAGMVIRELRAKCEELGIDDPTKRDDD